MKGLNAILSAVILISSTAALSAYQAPQVPDGIQAVPQPDQAAKSKQFVMDVGMSIMAEAELGKLASQRALNPAVKMFGQRMVTDHGKAMDELKRIAAMSHITLPTELNAKHKETFARLNRLSGQEFDRAYVDEMVLAHEASAAAFRTEAQNGIDPAVKTWASKTLPTVEEHLKMIQDIRSH